MENVESDPKTDRPKVCTKGEQTTAYWVLAGGICYLFIEPFFHQEEVCICATTVFVDPYEEADAQVRKVPGKSCRWLGAGGHTLRLWVRHCPPS